jgi:hypothetical protein
MAIVPLEAGVNCVSKETNYVVDIVRPSTDSVEDEVRDVVSTGVHLLQRRDRRDNCQ